MVLEGEQHTAGTAIPVLREASEAYETVQVLGTVHTRRGRFNPFLPENNLAKRAGRFVGSFALSRQGGRHGDGVYAVRFVADHDPTKVFKFDHQRLGEGGWPSLVFGERATQAHNLMFRVQRDGDHEIEFDPHALTYRITPEPVYLTEIESMQLNGFVWDGESDFEKFSETQATHQMRFEPDAQAWVLAVFLSAQGGMAHRSDGVYQFLFSANGNEDWGFGGDNRALGRLAGGTGFGSSGGLSIHSALTIRVQASGEYTFRVFPESFRFEVTSSQGGPAAVILNRHDDFALLGTVHPHAPWDPTVPEHGMRHVGGGRWQSHLRLQEGPYAVNFAIAHELFLDTMGLGAWLQQDDPHLLAGRAWHGKPNEVNVLFTVREPTDVEVTYDATCDRFWLRSSVAHALQAVTAIESLQLVGSFDAPLEAWQPQSRENGMERRGASRFVKDVFLQAGRRYQYKYTANHLPWLWTFADYPYDGYGQDYSARNPRPEGSSLARLRKYGQLTTHGDPAPLEFVAPLSSTYRFEVDLETGAYAVHLRPIVPTYARAEPLQVRKCSVQMTKQPCDWERFCEALEHRTLSVIESALAGGFNPNFKTPTGYTPLMLAAARGESYVVGLLIDAGADVNALDNRTGNSPLHFAAQGGSEQVAQALIGAGAHLNLQNPSQGHTPLIDAIIYKQPAVVVALLQAGANTEVRNNWGFGAADFLKVVAEQQVEQGRVTRIRTAFEARKTQDADKRASMHLYQAVLNGDLEGVKGRLAEGDNVNQVQPVVQSGDDGHTPLLAAARDGHGEIAQVLLGAGADMYMPDALYGAFPIFKSCYMGKLNTAQVQVEAGVDLRVQGPWNGFTPLHDALWQGHIAIADYLIEAGADLTLRALNGRSPLDQAIAEYGEGHPIVQKIRGRLAEGQ